MAVSETVASRPDRDAASERGRAIAFLTRRHRFRVAEALPWILALAAYFVFPDRMTFGSQVLLMAMFALSLDLILGYAGIVTLGHAAFFGVGAYTVGLLAAKLNWTEPITGLIAAAAVSALAGAASGWLLLRYRGLTLLVLTLATTFILQELGNAFDHFTGGYDGLPGLEFWPLLGVFDYDLYGRTEYLYALAVLFVVFMLVRRIVYSPFGQSLTGIRENIAPHARDRRAGAPAPGHRLHHRRGDRRHRRRAVHPDQRLCHPRRVRFRQLRRRDGDADPRRHRPALRRLRRRGGLHGAGGSPRQAQPRPSGSSASACCWSSRCCSRGAACSACSRTSAAGGPAEASERAEARHDRARARDRGPEQEFRRAAGRARHQSHARARRAPCPDRPERRRQDHAGQSDYRSAAAVAGQGPAQRRGHHRAAARRRAQARHRPHLPDQPAVPRPDRAGKSLYRGGRAHRRRQPPVAAGRRRTRRDRRGLRASRRAASLSDDALKLVRELPYGRQRLVEIAIALAQRPQVLLLDEPAAGVPSSESHLILDVVACARSRHRRPDHRARHGCRVPVRQADHRAGRRAPC